MKSDIKPGYTIRIKRMVGEPSYDWKEGIVMRIDDIGQLHGTWGGLAVQPERDQIEVLEKYEPDFCPAERYCANYCPCVCDEWCEFKMREGGPRW